MDETKTFVFPNNGGFGAFDGGASMWNNPIWAIVFLAAIRNGGILGNDGNCSQAFVSSQLGQAVAGNANAINNLSTHLDCSIGQVQTGIAAVQNAIQNVANQTGMSSLQVINAVQGGNAAIANQIASCCCDIKTAVNTGFGNLRYENAAQTCEVKQSIAGQTASVLAKLDAIEDSRKDREISNLTAQLTAANSRAERQAELAPIYKQLNDIACKQPQTIPVQYQPFTAIPNCVAYQMGLYGGYPYGLNPSGSIWS